MRDGGGSGEERIETSTVAVHQEVVSSRLTVAPTRPTRESRAAPEERGGGGKTKIPTEIPLCVLSTSLQELASL